AFVFVGVGVLAVLVFVPPAAVGQQGDQVGLRAAWREQGGFVAEDFRGVGLQGVDRWVVAVDVVAHLGGEHGFKHRGAGLGDGVAAQVDPAFAFSGNRARGGAGWIARAHGATPASAGVVAGAPV